MNILYRSTSILSGLIILVIWLGGCSGGGGSSSSNNNNNNGPDGPDGPDVFVTPPKDCGDPRSVCYDIVYVRYPDPGAGNFVSIPQGEHPYDLAPGADLILLRENGDEVVLVDCEDETGTLGNICSVMDPFISIDGKTVYYSLNTAIINNRGDSFESFIYKINLDDPTYTPIRMTYDDGFDSVLFQANRDVGGNVKADHDQSDWRPIRDMAPVPLADGRILFTSNRSALTTFHPRAEGVSEGSIQLMYTMDDHDGSAVTKELANIQRLETGNIHMVQHPMQLKDGRILFSTWQDAGTKADGDNFRYAMTSLFTVHPDGSNLQQFTEPHDHHKNVDHFVSQLPNEDVVWGYYYPSFDYGFGLIMRAPVDPPGPDFLRDRVPDLRFPWGSQFSMTFREFDRKEMVSLTPHSDSADVPSPGLSGKYSMPSAAAQNGLLVAYSQGSVNHFSSACAPSLCEKLRSGIYLIANATGDSSNFITNPTTQLIQVKDDPNFNEIWPRAVLSYGEIYGVSNPAPLKNLSKAIPDDDRLQNGEATAIVGTSSMYNREANEGADPDPFVIGKRSREQHDGNWTIQGAEAGIFADTDIHGVRIVATPPKPFTGPIIQGNGSTWNTISRHLLDSRLNRVVARFGSYHGERWEILGEFPVRKGAGINDGKGDPDTSWVAKIPAETPFFIQTLDDKGMTLTSEITWRALKPGENRSDCGGCHAHSVAPVDLATTAAGRRDAITGISGVANNDPKIANGMWDLTQGQIPLLTDAGIAFEPGLSYGVEFNRDIVPIFQARCVSCHSAGGNAPDLNSDPWAAISQPAGIDAPQVSQYIRAPQARQSLLVWAAWNERLDGRTNGTRGGDIDFTPRIEHANSGITPDEKRTLARWVDLGGPIDFPSTDGMGYTDDYQLPVVNIYTPFTGGNTGSELRVGLADAMSGLDLDTLEVKYFAIDDISSALPSDPSTFDESNIPALRQLMTDSEVAVAVVPADVNSKKVLVKNLGITTPGEYVVTVSVNDNVGNTGVAFRRFTIN